MTRQDATSCESMASQQAAAVAADIMQVQAAGVNPAGLQAAAQRFEQVSSTLMRFRYQCVVLDM